LLFNNHSNRKISDANIEYYRAKCISPELEMAKYLYVEITIMSDDVLVLWRAREGVFALSC